MDKENEIKKAIGETKKEFKRPSTKAYLAVLVVAVALIGFYALVSGHVTLDTLFSASVTNPVQAQATSGGISTGVQDISGNIDDISRTLGIS